MGKRSSFERIDKDFYRTIDKRAVSALGPVLFNTDGVKGRFAEPCAGEGDLILDMHTRTGWRCGLATDISDGPEYDALQIGSDILQGLDIILTNPPWSRPILHQMITHFSSLLPTWLLFDANWAQTKQSAPYIRELCTDIIAVGRLIWIPGTTMSGKDDAAWYRFDHNKDRKTVFHGR